MTIFVRGLRKHIFKPSCQARDAIARQTKLYRYLISRAEADAAHIVG